MSNFKKKINAMFNLMEIDTSSNGPNIKHQIQLSRDVSNVKASTRPKNATESLPWLRSNITSMNFTTLPSQATTVHQEEGTRI